MTPSMGDWKKVREGRRGKIREKEKGRRQNERKSKRSATLPWGRAHSSSL